MKKIRRILEDLYEVAYATAEVQEEYISDGEAVNQAQSETKKLLLTEGERKETLIKALENNNAWHHIEFPDDFPIEKVMEEICKDLAKALTQAQELKLNK